MEEHKLRIIKGAEELFFKFGIKSITMDDIAKHLGMSKKTIYQSVEDKEELLHILMESSLKEDEIRFKEVTKRSANVIEEVFQHMRLMNEVIGKTNPNLFYDLQKYHPNVWKLFTRFKEECILKMVEDSITRGIKEGFVREDVNAKVLAKLRIEEIEMGFNPHLFPPDKFKIVETQTTLIEHFLYGICTLKGHRLINKYKEIIEEE